MVQWDEWKNGWDTGVQVKIKLKQPLDKNLFLNFTSVYNYHACHSVIMVFFFFCVGVEIHPKFRTQKRRVASFLNTAFNSAKSTETLMVRA